MKTINAVKLKTNTNWVYNPSDEQLLAMVKAQLVLFEMDGVLMYDMLMSVSCSKKDDGKTYHVLNCASGRNKVSEDLKEQLVITELG